jgi:hypothetical protein
VPALPRIVRGRCALHAFPCTPTPRRANGRADRVGDPVGRAHTGPQRDDGCQASVPLGVRHTASRATLYTFLANNRDELIDRCKAKVAQRPSRAATEAQLSNGVPLFLGQLQRTLVAEEAGHQGESLRISGASGGDAQTESEMSLSAAEHGRRLWALGYTIDQVVHDYGDLCQAITDMAVERDAPFSVSDFRTLNRCLDNAIASAATHFSARRDVMLARRQAADSNERLGSIVHELRNSLGTAVLAAKALEVGSLPMAGATGGVLKRAHITLKVLIEQMIDQVRDQVAVPVDGTVFSLADFIAEVEQGARLQVKEYECLFDVAPVEPELAIAGDRDRLMSALSNLLQNAFKYTKTNTRVDLRAHAVGDRVLIDVSDHCGGISQSTLEQMFFPFTQRHDNRTGLGLGLSIARHNVESDAGTLTVQNHPGLGCVFTIELPRQMIDAPQT